MSYPQGAERARYVQQMFSRIARRYDLMNRLMTVGQDKRWRKEVIRRAALPSGGWLLDLGAGTGDLAFEALAQQPTVKVVAADFTLAMMRVGQSRGSESAGSAGFPAWCAGDAASLPFPACQFDALVSGFLLRNVIDLRGCLVEQLRLLKPGGWMVALDTTPPPRTPLAPLLRFHMHRVIPALGRLISGQVDAYRYLPDSTEGFVDAEKLAALIERAGFQQVGFQHWMFGTIAIHWGRRPEAQAA